MIVLIPGASGGFGRVLASRLAAHGWTVYGTARRPEPAEPGAAVTLLPMEIGDETSIRACVDEVLKREGRIDVLINCVNEMVIGAVEEQSVEEVRALYETNVFGALQLWQAVIPAMRSQGGGTIVTMSSLGGILAVPYMSAYTSAKFALEAMTEALYHELAPDGIDVVIMQPVAMKLERPALGGHLRLVEGVAAGSRSHAMAARMARDTEASGLTPEAVAERVYEVVSRERKPLRVPMDRARALGVVKRLAPQSLLDRLIRGLLPDS